MSRVIVAVAEPGKVRELIRAGHAIASLWDDETVAVHVTGLPTPVLVVPPGSVTALRRVLVPLVAGAEATSPTWSCSRGAGRCRAPGHRRRRDPRHSARRAHRVREWLHRGDPIAPELEREILGDRIEPVARLTGPVERLADPHRAVGERRVGRDHVIRGRAPASARRVSAASSPATPEPAMTTSGVSAVQGRRARVMEPSAQPVTSAGRGTPEEAGERAARTPR